MPDPPIQATPFSDHTAGDFGLPSRITPHGIRCHEIQGHSKIQLIEDYKFSSPELGQQSPSDLAAMAQRGSDVMIPSHRMSFCQLDNGFSEVFSSMSIVTNLLGITSKL